MDILNTKDALTQKHTNEELYHKQMALLKTFLERRAISQEQYNISTKDLAEKMGVDIGTE